MFIKSRLFLPFILILCISLTTSSDALADGSFEIEKITFSNNTPFINSQINITVTIKNTSTGEGAEYGNVTAYIGIQRPDSSRFYLQSQQLTDIERGSTKDIVFKYNTGFIPGKFYVDCDIWDPSETKMYYTSGFIHELIIKKEMIRAMWVWNTDIIYGAESGIDQLLNFCTAPHNNSSKRITLIYLYVNPESMQTNDQSLRNFIQKATGQGISVHALYGEIPWDGDTASTYKLINYVLEYNKQCPSPASRFKGVHLDHEFWETDKNEKYKDLINGIKSYSYNHASMNSQNLSFGIDTGEEWECYFSHYVSELFKISDLEFITVMSYRDRASDIIFWSADEITAGNNLGKTVLVGVETHRPNPDPQQWPHPENTFYEEGNIRMESELNKVEKQFAGQPSYIGIAVHYYQAYYDLFDLVEDLVAHYSFDGNASDISGNGHDGVEHGEIQYIDGMSGQAAQFDGVDDYISMEGYKASDFNIDGNKHRTISFWMQLPDSSYGTIFKLGSESLGELWAFEDGNDNFWRVKGYGTMNDIDFTYHIPSFTWTNISITYNGSVEKVYVNGEMEIKKNMELNTGNDFDLWLGKDPYYGTSPNESNWDGVLDDLKIYKSELSGDAIKSLYYDYLKNVTIVGTEKNDPRHLSIHNYPNPFNTTTAIDFEIPVSGNVNISIFNMSGRCIKTLINTLKNKGHYQIAWDGRDANNASVAPGIYLCRVRSGNAEKVIKMVLLKK